MRVLTVTLHQNSEFTAAACVSASLLSLCHHPSNICSRVTEDVSVGWSVEKAGVLEGGKLLEAASTGEMAPG